MSNGNLLVFFLAFFLVGFFYLFFISDYSLTELEKKKTYLDLLRNNFYQEKNTQEHLLRLSKKSDQNLAKYLNEYGFVENNEILVDIQVLEKSSFFEKKPATSLISRSSVIFLTTFLVMVALGLLWHYKKSKANKSLVNLD